MRLTGASAGSFSGDVTASSSPAANKTVAVSGTTSAAGCGDYHHALYNRGTPVYTYYLGDKLQYQFEFALNQDTTGYTVEYGLGRNTTGTGWTWRDAVWSRLDGDGNVNRVWISKQNEQQFTDTGNWYYAGRFTSGGCTWYADGDWEQTTGGGFTASSYFTVNALNNPSGQSATRNSGSPTSQIDLSWSKNAQGHNVMVVRKPAASSWTEPTQGTSYAVNASLGAGTVVYNGSGTAMNNTGLTADTTYDYKFYSVNNNYYSAGVTAQASTMAAEPASSPTSLSFSAIGTSGLTINWDGVSTKVLVVVRAGSDVSADPVDGTTYTANANYGGGGSALGNGKVVYEGTGTSVELSGLSAGTVYYVRIYNFNGGDGAENYRTTSPLAGSKITCPAAPTVQAASAVGSDRFTANWSAVTGASSYRLDVSTSPTFTGGPVNLMTNPGFETGDSTGWDTVETQLNVSSSDANSGTYSLYAAPTATRKLMQKVSITGDGTTQYEISYWYKGTGNVRIWASWSSGGVVTGDNLQPGSYNGDAATWTKMTYTVTPQSGNNVLDFEVRFYNGAKIYVDDFFVGVSGGGGAAFVSGYEDLTVSGTSQIVTGLEQDTKYYYRVRAVNDSCVSEYSGTQDVTTMTATPDIALGNNGTQVAAAEVGAGTTAHVLHKSQLAVTTAKAVLTGVSFTSAGTYAATDISNFKVWYSADNTLDTGSDTPLGTISTSLGTGSHSLSSLSQTINAGNTGYIFITADIAASPTGGKTISVSALTTGDFTFAAGNKSGSTSAGGAQTIVVLPSLSSPTASDIGPTAATLGANVTSLGGASALTARGTVYNTTGSPVTQNGAAATGTGTGAFSHERTGLSQGTKYYYRGYAENAAGTAYSADGSFYTEPGQASSVVIDSLSATGMKVTWTAGVNSDGAIVVMRAGNSTVTDPTDGTLHSANAAFGSGDNLGSDSYVVYRGSGTSVDVTGLTPGTTYYVEVFAYKGTVADSGNDKGINYRQASPATGNSLTCPAAPTIAAASSVADTSFYANWSSVTSATNYYLDVWTEDGGGAPTTHISENIQNWTSETSYGNYQEVISAGTVNMTDCIVAPTAGATSPATVGSVQIKATTGILELPAVNSVGTVIINIRSGGTSRTIDLEKKVGSGSWTKVGTISIATATTIGYTNDVNDTSANIALRLVNASHALYIHDIVVYSTGGGITYVTGYNNKLVGNVTTYQVTGLDVDTEYFYRVRAQNAVCTSTDSATTNVTTAAATPTVALADNGTQVATANVAAGTTAHVLHKFKLTVGVAQTTLTALQITTAGHDADDLTNLKLWYSADDSFESGSDTTIGTINSPGAFGTKTFSSMTKDLAIGTHYFFITADIAGTATAGNTASVGAIANTAVTVSAGTKSGGPTTAGGAQTITSAVTISNTGTPAAGNVAAGTANVVLFGFQISPATGSIDFTGLKLTTAGSATASDLSNFRVVYDADNSGTYNGGDSVVSGAGVALANPINFTISSQTGISAARRYLVIADVASSPTAGRTFTGSIASAGDVTTTGTESGTAAGNAQTIVTVPTVTTPTVTDIGQTAATLGANVTANGGLTLTARGTVWGTSANPTGNAAAEGGTATGVFSHNRSGLSQGTKYYYRGYAVNSVGTAYSADGSFYTEPGQASSVQFANVAHNAMRISWTAGGSSDGAIVVMRASSAVVNDPTDGTLHTADAAFGSGANLGNNSFVVYRGSGTQVDVTGLSAGTTYHVAVYAYKGTVADSGNDKGINYRQTSPATGSRSTMAAEPTTHASSLSFSNVGAYDMKVGWTVGNGAGRIVVVRQGSAVSWTPTDGTAPTGVSADFSAAADQGSGNKICYSGTGNNFTLSGLDPETTYYVKIFEYNGSSTEINYYTGGTPLAGSQATTAAACVPAEVNILQRAAYYTTWESGGGIFNNGSNTNELGQWANTGDKQSVAWRKFKTNGNGTGDDRELQPGDRFRISVWGYSPAGILGVSLNDGAATGSWANRHSNTRGYIQCGNGSGDLYVTDANGSLSWSGIRPWDTTLTMEFHILSSKEFTANIVGQTPKYDLSMLNSPGDTDRVDGYSIYYNDGGSDVYWKPETAVTNLGYVEFGADGGTRTIYGKITDGTDPHCPEVTSPNYLKKSGSGTITLNNANSTYTLYTDIAGGTLQIAADGALGTAPATAQAQHIRLAGGAALVLTDNLTLNANRGITLYGNNAFLAVADNKVVDYAGAITDGASSYGLIKNQGGELILRGASTYDGCTYIDNGTLTVSNASALGTGQVDLGQGSGSPSFPATLKLVLSGMTLANTPITIKDNSSGVKTIQAVENATLSGAIAIDEKSDDQFAVDVANGKTLTLSGVMSGDTGGGKITKTGAGTVVISGNNTHDKKVQLNAGTVAISASRNLGADPAGAYANKVYFNGGTLKATDSFTMHANNLTTLGAGNGTVEVDSGRTLTYAPVISGSGTLTKTGAGTLIFSGANTFSGALTVSAGTAQVGAGGTSGVVGANIVNNATLVWNRSDSLTYSGVISGTGAMTKNGAGTLTLSGTSTMSGATTVSAGTLLVSGSLANSAVTVSSGATLMGAGRVGALTVGGTVDPGNSANAVGKLECGALTLNAGGALRVDMANVSGTAGTHWDLLAGGAITANASGTFTINVAGNPTGWNATAGYSWTIISGSSVSSFSAGRFTVNTASFTPGLDGGSFSVENVGNNIVLVFTPRKPAVPQAFSASKAGADSVTLTFTRNAQSDDVIIVYDLDGTFSDPGGTAPAVGQSFAGGTVVYKGGTSPQTHASLAACTKYYYKAWSYKGTNYSATGLTGDATTDPPAAPATIWASATNETDFTASWAAASGATGYRLDVSLYEDFQTAGGDTDLISKETMGTTGTAGSSIATHETNNRFVNTALTMSGTGDMRNTSESSGYTGASGGFNVMLNTSGETFIMEGINSSGKTGMKLSFGVRKNTNAEDGSTITVHASTNGTTWVSCGSPTLPTGENGWYYRTLDVPNTMAGSNLRIRFTSSSTVEWRLDDIILTASGAAEPSFVDGYNNLLVSSGTSQLVEGLAGDTKYYFRVRAEGGDGACASANSSVANVTTLVSSTVALADNGTQVAAADIAPGSTFHILHKFKLTVGTKPTTLTGVKFTTAEGYAAADVSKFQVWYSTDSSLTLADTKLGSDITTSLGPGEHSVSSLTQSLSVGDHYIFITADIAAGATLCNALAVNAITTGDVTVSGGSKSGSTTAGGAQTFVAAKPAAHPTGLTFSAVGTTSMQVGWTLPDPAPAGVLVVVRQGSAVSWTPTDKALVSGINANFGTATDQGSGNKVVYNGSGSSVTLSGLTAETTYHVAIYPYNGSGSCLSYYTGGTPLTGNHTTACMDVTASLYANATNYTEFTATWSAVAGATGYLLDVATDQYFTSGLTSVLEEDFVKFTTADSTEITSSLDTYTQVSGWSGERVYSAAAKYMAKLGSSTARGVLITPTVDLSGNSGAATVSFQAAAYGTDSTVIQVFHAANGSDFTQLGADITLTGTMTTYSRNITGGTASSKVRIMAKNATSYRFYLDDFLLEAAGTGSFVPGYQSLAGAVECVRACAAAGPVGICSGALRSDILPVLANLGIADCFAEMVTADDVAMSKPDPACYRMCLARLAARFPERGVRADNCVAIEDTPDGIASARGAELPVVGVTTNVGAEDLGAAGARAVVETLAGVVPEDLARLAGLG